MLYLRISIAISRGKYKYCDSYTFISKAIHREFRIMAMAKFIQTLSDTVFADLKKIADEKGISVQELIRAVIVPDYLKEEKHTL